ncbi:MAG: twin-arginine translocation signal domain-containing protein [Acidobacteriota bacterium]|nr:twin-arginine translocation signal domain-containing protein [Acidobacteriota bacterium]
MKFSRRHFIKLGGATAAAIFGFGSFTFGQKNSVTGDDFPAEMFADPLYGHGADNFRKYLGTEFSLMTKSETITAVLADVKSSVVGKNKKFGNKRAECFTLSFNLPSDAPQATYKVLHPNLGNFDLFLVPGKSDEADSLLHAVINRI